MHLAAENILICYYMKNVQSCVRRVPFPILESGVLSYLICSRHSIRSRAVTNRIFLFRKVLFSFNLAQHSGLPSNISTMLLNFNHMERKKQRKCCFISIFQILQYSETVYQCLFLICSPVYLSIILYSVMTSKAS